MVPSLMVRSPFMMRSPAVVVVRTSPAPMVPLPTVVPLPATVVLAATAPTHDVIVVHFRCRSPFLFLLPFGGERLGYFPAFFYLPTDTLDQVGRPTTTAQAGGRVGVSLVFLVQVLFPPTPTSSPWLYEGEDVDK